MSTFFSCGWGVLLAAFAAEPGPARLAPGRFGTALNLGSGERQVILRCGDMMRTLPVTFEFWARLSDAANYNVILSAAPKSGLHWEIYTTPKSGFVSLFIPRHSSPDNQSRTPVVDGHWHFYALRLAADRVQLFLDGREVFDLPSTARLQFDGSPIIVGGLDNASLRCTGAIDDLRISRGNRPLAGGVPHAPRIVEPDTLHLYSFDTLRSDRIPDAADVPAPVPGTIQDAWVMPEGDRFLDEVQDEAYARSTLHGSEWVERESRLPVFLAEARREDQLHPGVGRPRFSLDGAWRMASAEPKRAAELLNSFQPRESEGIRNGWFQPGFDRSNWLEVTVPTTVQSALVKARKLPDPFWDRNTWDELDQFGEPKAMGVVARKTRVEQKEWWFARRFTPPSNWRGKRVRLCFDGVDYAGSFYLNGRPLGYHAGMFGGPEFEVSDLLDYTGENELAVRLDPPPFTWSGILKGSPGWGWHYGHLISVGLWRSIWLEVVPEIELESPYVVTRTITDEAAELEVEFYLENHAGATKHAEVGLGIMGKNFQQGEQAFATDIVAVPGRSRYRTRVTLRDPHLWWPMNYGNQALYALGMQVTAGDAVLDSAGTTFGVRTIRMVPMPGTRAESDYRWGFMINGTPMFIKGANWCWSDPMLQLDQAKYERLLELARRAGIQMFRAWGGGIIETDTFYRLCDEKGIMVYQEFPYCWGPPDFPVTDPMVLDDQVTRVVKRLRNHPALVLWGGGNENVRIEGADEGLFLVGRRCRQYDPSRPFHRTDPWGGSVHNWSVFHQGAPIDSGYRGRPTVFLGEYGIPSMPDWSSNLRFLPRAVLDKWPPTDDEKGLIMHLNQFNLRDPVKVLRYADYGPVRNWRQYIEYSQMAQSDGLRFAAEMQRAGSGRNKSGFWFYKFTDLFPGHSWAVVDFYGIPKLSYWRARQACRPRNAFLTYDRLDWPENKPFRAVLHVANDTNRPIAGARVQVALFGSDLSEFWRRKYLVADVPANGQLGVDALRVNLPADRGTPFLAGVRFETGSGELISDNWYWFNFKHKTDAIRQIEKEDAWAFPTKKVHEAFAAYAATHPAPLLELPRTRLDASIASTGPHRGQLRVHNRGRIPAFNVLIDGFPVGWHDFLDDNSFCLWPGETRTVGFETERPVAALTDVQVRAWNADGVDAKPPGK